LLSLNVASTIAETQNRPVAETTASVVMTAEMVDVDMPFDRKEISSEKDETAWASVEGTVGLGAELQ
jgi:hypothetical protein